MSESTALSAADPISKQLGFKFVSITELSDEQKKVLKDTVAKGTTDTELAYFLNVSLAQDLDPFRKECWCIVYGIDDKRRLTVQTGRDGFLKIAKRDPTFDRIQSSEVRDGDDFRMDPITGEIEHRFTAKRGAILGAYAVITRKDGTRLAKYVSITEYKGGSDIWSKYTSAMLTKVAESMLCKQFANITGISAEESMPDHGISANGSPAAQEQQSTLKDRLIAQIQACTTTERFDALRKELAGVVGKLFGPEKDAVFEAAKRKKDELNAIIIEPIHEPETATIPPTPEDPKLTINGKPIKRTKKPKAEDAIDATPQHPIELSTDEMAELMEAIKLHDTSEGLDDLWNAVISTKPKSLEQQAALEAAYQQAKKELGSPTAQ